MANFEAPSFSLGLDLDLDSEPQVPTREPFSGELAPGPSSSATLYDLEDDECFEPLVLDSDHDLGENSAPVLRRLRRGLNNGPASVHKRESVEVSCNVDEEIEEFSSQEGLRGDDRSSTQYHSVCGSSKFPLHGHGALRVNHSKASKKKQAWNGPASASLEMSSNKLTFPKLTVSPIRRFQLLDSDSDDSSVSGDVSRDANGIDQPSKERLFNTEESATRSEQKIKKASADLWEDFHPIKSFTIPTPALDEVCEEYFRHVKDKDAAHKQESDICLPKDKSCQQIGNISKNVDCQWGLGSSLPPAHRYFFHEDLRIQKLVRGRLSNFFPLGVMNSEGNQQSDATVIDYMSQFSHGENSKRQATGNGKTNTRSVKSRKKSENSSAAKASNASGSWVNPKCDASTPKNAGKRRVCADGQSSGHWYTGSDGRKVYVTKSGQELTGQIAYRQYRKESGAGLRRSKKKATAKSKKK
ncbi:uncharacterized protein LOC131160739 isoform X2 [Malania oleifera]|uniref:uncharacterized protein LOC131160739 isoform X2 n=1 Tax=Malania oleifera TaxID=397392 RepID=UPI0025AE94E6|nr:uncharacterized protein LOC131160739 isoform X2 [Malania oleifera]